MRKRIQSRRCPGKLLELLDADISLRVGRLKHEGLLLEDVKAAMTLIEGDLSLPVSLIYEGLPVSARIAATTSGDIPEIAFSFASESVALAPLLKLMGEEGKFTGQTGSVVLDGNSRGQGILDMIENVAVNMQLAGTRLSTKAGEMFVVKAASLELEAGGVLCSTGKVNFWSVHLI